MTRLALDSAVARRERDIRGLTNFRLAELARVNTKTIASVMAGRPVNLASALSVAKVFGAVAPIPALEALIATSSAPSESVSSVA